MVEIIKMLVESTEQLHKSSENMNTDIKHPTKTSSLNPEKEVFLGSAEGPKLKLGINRLLDRYKKLKTSMGQKNVKQE